jgi:hypothetical protein
MVVVDIFLSNLSIRRVNIEREEGAYDTCVYELIIDVKER